MEWLCFRLVIALLVCLFLQITQAKSAEIFWPPISVIVPLGQANGAVFNCNGQGSSLMWRINGDLVTSNNKQSYESRGLTFSETNPYNGTLVITVTLPATAENNNTQLKCQANGNPGPIISETATLMIAGPPLTPNPRFMIVNATHIKLEWDKPFALHGYDIRNYTMLILSLSSLNDVTTIFTVSHNTVYPFVYYISNEQVLPRDSNILNFTLTATNDAGNSNPGFVTGCFAIEPEVTDNSIKVLHNDRPELLITIQLRHFCTYQSINYTVSLLEIGAGVMDSITSRLAGDLFNHTLDVVFTESDGFYLGRTYQLTVKFTTEFYPTLVIQREIYSAAPTEDPTTTRSTESPTSTPISTESPTTMPLSTQSPTTAKLKPSTKRSTTTMENPSLMNNDHIYYIISGTILGGMIIVVALVIVITSVVCIWRCQGARSGNRTASEKQSAQNPICKHKNNLNVAATTVLQNNDDQEHQRQHLQRSDHVHLYERVPHCNISQIIGRSANGSNAEGKDQVPQNVLDEQLQMYEEVQRYERIGTDFDIPLQLLCAKPSRQEQIQSPSAMELILSHFTRSKSAERCDHIQSHKETMDK